MSTSFLKRKQRLLKILLSWKHSNIPPPPELSPAVTALLDEVGSIHDAASLETAELKVDNLGREPAARLVKLSFFKALSFSPTYPVDKKITAEPAPEVRAAPLSVPDAGYIEPSQPNPQLFFPFLKGHLLKAEKREAKRHDLMRSFGLALNKALNKVAEAKQALNEQDEEQGTWLTKSLITLVVGGALAAVVLTGKLSDSLPSPSSFVEAFGFNQAFVRADPPTLEPKETLVPEVSFSRVSKQGPPATIKFTLSSVVETESATETEAPKLSGDFAASRLRAYLQGLTSGNLRLLERAAADDNRHVSDLLRRNSALIAAMPAHMMGGGFGFLFSTLVKSAFNLKDSVRGAGREVGRLLAALSSPATAQSSSPSTLSQPISQTTETETPKETAAEQPLAPEVSTPSPIKPPEQRLDVASTLHTTVLRYVEQAAAVNNADKAVETDLSVKLTAYFQQQKEALRTTFLPTSSGISLPVEDTVPEVEVVTRPQLATEAYLGKDSPLQSVAEVFEAQVGSSSNDSIQPELKSAVSRQAKVTLNDTPHIPDDERLFKAVLLGYTQ